MAPPVPVESRNAQLEATQSSKQNDFERDSAGIESINGMLMGGWGFPYLKIEKLPTVHFMFFDRYEIHIRAFVDFIYAKCIISRSSSSQIYITNRYVNFQTKWCLILYTVSKQTNFPSLRYEK